jgi:DNA replication protein DnaC
MTPEQINDEALAIWHAERCARLAENLLVNRPPEFAAPGELDPRLQAWARLLAGGISQNVILTGPVGTGKTWTIWRAAEEAIRCGYDKLVIVTTAARLRRIIAPATADPGEFERYCAAGLLAVDDLASFRLSEWDLDHLGELVDIRWSQHRPVIVSSNVTKLKDLLGPRISSRLQHDALVVELDGTDRRRQP